MSSDIRPRLSPSWLVRLAVVVVLVGIGSGLSGLVVSVGLHALEHFAYGYSSGTFLHGVRQSADWRRITALVAAGMIGAVGWWALRRWARRVVSVEESVAGQRMPVLVTLANAALQIVIVGLGASVGREVAPRELGAMIAGWLSERARLTPRETRILIACGAGAGLAAVYDVPLGGALFAIEILLAEISFATAIPALATSAVATLLAQVAVPSGPLYVLPQFSLTPSLLVWSILAGPIVGFAAWGFAAGIRWAIAHRVSGNWILVVMPLVFAAVGALSLFLPAILGNGKAIGEVAFTETIPLWLMVGLMVAKAVATTGTIFSGAAGGTLTPSLALGAALGFVLGGLWSVLWPGTPLAAFAFVAASAFLASSLRAPFTALVLLLEFTGEGPQLLVPMMIAIAGSVAIAYLLRRPAIQGAP